MLIIDQIYIKYEINSMLKNAEKSQTKKNEKTAFDTLLICHIIQTRQEQKDPIKMLQIKIVSLTSMCQIFIFLENWSRKHLLT